QEKQNQDQDNRHQMPKPTGGLGNRRFIHDGTRNLSTSINKMGGTCSIIIGLRVSDRGSQSHAFRETPAVLPDSFPTGSYSLCGKMDPLRIVVNFRGRG